MVNRNYLENNLVVGLFAVGLFFLVISVFYTIISLSDIIRENNLDLANSLQVFAPLVVLTGFFIFLVAAMLLALSLFRVFVGFK